MTIDELLSNLQHDPGDRCFASTVQWLVHIYGRKSFSGRGGCCGLVRATLMAALDFERVIAATFGV
jgi:hypothetical protein